MARLLFPSDEPWFDELRIISSYSETELEKMILSHVDTVFPQYITIPFKKVLKIPTASRGKAPDLAIISKEYNEWWIVEVETDEDDFNHVKSQLQVFSNYDYNSIEIAKYIQSKDESRTLLLEPLIQMVRDIKPQVLVMVDEVNSDWVEDISKLGAQICVFQVYKNKEGLHAFRINGHYPQIFTSDKSHCKFIKSPANTLEVYDPKWFESSLENMEAIKNTKFNLFSGQSWKGLFNKPTKVDISINEIEIEIDFLGKVSKWRVIKDGEKIYLKSIGINKVPVINTYTLYSDSSLKFYLKHN